MESQRRQIVEALFVEVADLDPAARRQRLEARCAEDPDLRAEVEALLVAARRAAPAGITAAADRAVREVAKEWALGSGDVLGAFRVVEPLAHAGAGEVYVAEPLGSPVRTVTVKPMRFEAEDRAALERFAIELQAVVGADLDAVVTVHAATHGEEGWPYVVVEHTAGVVVDTTGERRDLEQALQRAVDEITSRRSATD